MAGRLFMSRLDEARSPVSEKTHQIGRRARARTEEIYELEEDTGKGKSRSTDSQQKKEYGDNSEILEKLAEYLFDLFDANLMEDYAKMEKLEIRALDCFQDFDQTEFTHQQHAIHREFVQLFEQLIEGFLGSEGYTIETFYEELEHFINKTKDTKSSRSLGESFTPAEEVMAVISSYLQFEVWSDLMRKQARQQAEFATMREKLMQCSNNVNLNSARDADSEAKTQHK